MTETGIIELYWLRDERAIDETDARYGAYCHALAFGILADRGEAEAEELGDFAVWTNSDWAYLCLSGTVDSPEYAAQSEWLPWRARRRSARRRLERTMCTWGARV